jgi:hypothetical protein
MSLGQLARELESAEQRASAGCATLRLRNEIGSSRLPYANLRAPRDGASAETAQQTGLVVSVIPKPSTRSIRSQLNRALASC